MEAVEWLNPFQVKSKMADASKLEIKIFWHFRRLLGSTISAGQRYSRDRCFYVQELRRLLLLQFGELWTFSLYMCVGLSKSL